MFTLLILEYTLSSIVVFLFILKFEVYKIYALQCCIFAPSFGMHKKTSQPDVGAVSTDTATHIELSNVVATLISYCWIWGRNEDMHCISYHCIIAYAL
jgi:hypothetical protein